MMSVLRKEFYGFPSRPGAATVAARVKKVGWYAGSVALILVIGGGLLLLAANLYVQSQGVQQQIRRALASSLRMPAELTKTTVTPWEGLRIDGITIRPEATPGQAALADVLKADSFRVRFALRPLLERRFVVTEILLDRPQLAWAQDAEGRWRFPPAAAEPPPPPPVEPEKNRPPPPPAPVVPPVAPPLPSPPAIVETKPAAAKPARFRVDVDKFRLRHGTLDFLNANAVSVGRFEEVNIDGRMHGPRSSSGTVGFDKAVLPRAGLSLLKFQSRFQYDAAGFSLADGQGELGGGKIFLAYTVHTAESGSPFEAQCHFDQVALERLAPALGAALQGRLRGVLKAGGLAGDPTTRHGTGQFSLMNGKLKDFPMLKTIGDSLRIEDLSRMEFKTAQLDCHLEGEQFFVDHLNLVSNDLRLTAKGRYDGAQDRLDLQARLVIDQAIGRQLPQFIETNFTPCGNEEPPGSRYLEFSIGGPVSKPTTNLLERVLSGPMGNLFQNILAPKPKNPNKKSRKNQPPPAVPTPEPAASPAE